MQWRELDLTRNGSGSTLASGSVRNGIARRHRHAPELRASRSPGSKYRRYRRVRPKTRQAVLSQDIFQLRLRSHPYNQHYHRRSALCAMQDERLGKRASIAKCRDSGISRQTMSSQSVLFAASALAQRLAFQPGSSGSQKLPTEGSSRNLPA